MENNYFAPLDFDFVLDQSYLTCIQQDPSLADKRGPFVMPEQYRDGRLIGLLAETNLTIRYSEIFHTFPWNDRSIHVDGPRLDDHAKINLVIGAPASAMTWYMPKEGLALPHVEFNSAGTRHLSYTADQCQLVYKTNIQGYALVNVGVPHNVLNQTPEHRWCISMQLGHKGTDTKITFGEARALLSRHIR